MRRVDRDCEGTVARFSGFAFELLIAERVGDDRRSRAHRARTAIPRCRLFPSSSACAIFQHRNDVLRSLIDPTAYPIIAGKTADLYVVAHESVAQWAQDASLTDVRGMPQTVTFAAGGIQTNTFDVAHALLLDGDAGLDLGLPYDVVVDFDRDGLLDRGDFIDG